MQASDRGLLEIAEHEGIVPAPYRDSVGVWTWGIGHTKGAGDPDPAKLPMPMPHDLDAAIEAVIDQFRIDVARYDARVSDAIKVPLAQHQRDALVSFDLNTGGIYRAILTREINAGAHDASEHFFGWLKPPEIKGRRTDEKLLFDTGDYSRNGDKIAIWRTNGAGKLSGIMKTISGDELLERMHAKPLPADLPPMPDLSAAERALMDAEAAQVVLADAMARLRGEFDRVAA